MVRGLWLAPVALFALTPRAAEKPKLPPAPAPTVELTVVVPSPEATRWKVRVENKGAVPLRLAADARLVSFDIEPASTEPAQPAGARATAKPKSVHCALPADMRPSNDDERALVLPPGRAYVETIDPRLYCFGAKEAAALAAGGKVSAQLGWSGRLERPFAVAPFEGVEPRVSAAKSIAAAPFTLAPAPTPTAAPTPSATATPSLAPRLSVSTAPFVDVERGAEIATTVTVSNASDRAASLRLRPDTVTFSVTSPTGSLSRCSRPVVIGSPTRELFDGVAAHGSASVAVLLTVLCPEGTFDQPGLYRVVAGIDTRRASGERIGLATFEGELEAERPTLLRVRTPRRPLVQPRPVLE